MLDFVERFGAAAARLGWTAPQPFGVHPQNGTLRTDWCGALIVRGQKAAGVDARRVAFGTPGACRDTLGPPVAVPIWDQPRMRADGPAAPGFLRPARDLG